jgi:DNA-binding transcriptional MerR regulator
MELRIGELARRVQLNPKTIRYYEERGLLSKPKRSESGYRLYTQEEETRLRLIKRAKLLGLSLQETKAIVDYATDGHCLTLKAHLLELLRAKLAQTEERITELRLFQQELRGFCRSLEDQANGDDRQTKGEACGCLDSEGDGAMS